MPALSTRTEIHKDVLRRLADARLAELDTLRKATPPHYAAALYLGGYAVEALLKCAICQALNLDELPVIFHVHDLDVLLFFSGRYQEIQTDAAVLDSFSNIQAAWSEKRRYTDPTTATAAECNDLDQWLNNPTSGVVPWLKARL
jgi:hypothetical protein